MSLYFWSKTLLIVSILYCSGCARVPDQLVGLPGLELKKTADEHLPGFETDKVEHALSAFRKSCKKIVKKNPNTRFGSQSYAGLVKDWASICTGLPSKGSKNSKYREYLVKKFNAYKIIDLSNSPGLFTGYFEPVLKGSMTVSYTHLTLPTTPYV